MPQHTGGVKLDLRQWQYLIIKTKVKNRVCLDHVTASLAETAQIFK